MATLATATRNAMADGAVDLIDGGSGAGTLQIGTTGFASTLITFTLSDPAFGAAVTGVASASDLPIAAVAAATGTAAEYRVRDSAGNTIWSGASVTASGGGGEVQMTSLSITSGQSVNLTAFSFTMPAS